MGRKAAGPGARTVRAGAGRTARKNPRVDSGRRRLRPKSTLGPLAVPARGTSINAESGSDSPYRIVTREPIFSAGRVALTQPGEEPGLGRGRGDTQAAAAPGTVIPAKYRSLARASSSAKTSVSGTGPATSTCSVSRRFRPPPCLSASLRRARAGRDGAPGGGDARPGPQPALLRSFQGAAGRVPDAVAVVPVGPADAEAEPVAIRRHSGGPRSIAGGPAAAGTGLRPGLPQPPSPPRRPSASPSGRST